MRSMLSTTDLGIASLGRILPAAMVACAGHAASAQPEGERVVAGQASFVRDGAATTITAADRTIIEYQSFDIARDHRVQFVQPHADAAVLNRVLGASPTQINGTLSANGRVYLVNEAGVYFGSTAVVNAGAIHAAAGRMDDADFLAGIDRFTGLTGSVEQHGAIEAGAIHLAGRRVTNTGSLASYDGLVTLSAGDEVLLGRRDGHLFVDITGASGGSGTTSEVEQSGRIDAGRGAVAIGAGDMFSIALRPTSSITASRVTVEGVGQGIVTASGAVDASNSAGAGGLVAVSGERVAVLGLDADASGTAGGGEILLGGGLRGDGSVVAPSRRINVDADSVLRADAIDAGDGGTIVTWSEDATVFRGSVQARGGAGGGDGGFVEVSSRGALSFDGAIDTSASLGSFGTFLLDPDRIFVGANPFAPDDGLLDDAQIPIAEAVGTNVTISKGALEALGATSVLLEAAVEIAIGGFPDGSLNFGAEDGQSVTINAGERFRVEDGTRLTTQGGDLSITASESIQTSGLETRGGAIALTAGDSVAASEGILTTGAFAVRATNPGGIVELAGAEVGSILLEADSFRPSANLLVGSDVDLVGLPEIRLPTANTVVTIGAVSGGDTFDLRFDPATQFEGGGGVRFVGSTVRLPAIDGLSRLEVSATERVELTGDLLIRNIPGGLEGTIDLSDSASVFLISNVTLDTDTAGSTGDGGAVLLGGTTVSGPGRTLTIDTTADADGQSGRIELGGIDTAGLVLSGGDLVLRGSVAQNGLDFSNVAALRVEDQASIGTLGGDVDFAGLSVDGPGALSIDLEDVAGTSGSLVGLGDVGMAEPLASFSITGGSFDVPTVRTTGSQAYTASGVATLTGDLSSETAGTISLVGQIALTGDTALTTAGALGDDVRIVGTLLGADRFLTTRTLLGSTEVDGDISVGTLAFDGSTALRDATVEAAGLLRLGGQASRDTIIVETGTSTVRSTGGDVVFRGGVQGPASLTTTTDTSVAGDDIPIIRFEGSVGNQSPLAALQIGQGRMDVPEVATIVVGRINIAGDPIPGLGFGFFHADTFTMGPNEKLTALGPLTIEAGSQAALGDLTVTGDLTVRAPDILINTRAAAPLASIDTSTDPVTLVAAGLDDTGVDFVVGGGAVFEGTVRRSDLNAPMPTLSEPNGDVLIPGLQIRALNEPLTDADVVFNRRTGAGGGMIERTTVLDAQAFGATTVPLSSSIVDESVDRSAIVRLADVLQLPSDDPVIPNAASEGFGVRGPSPTESRSAARGVRILSDYPTTLRDAGRVSVAAQRLAPGALAGLEAALSRLTTRAGFAPGDTDRALSRVRSAFDLARTSYRTSTGRSLESADGFELYAALAGVNEDANALIRDTAALIESIRGLGVSEGERRRLEDAVLDAVTPRSMSVSTSRGVIEAVLEGR